MIEAQGRGTLHGHFLIWLYGAPPNWFEFERTIERDPNYRVKVLQYADSIVTTGLPNGEQPLSCQVGDDPEPNRVRLRTPKEAYCDPMRISNVRRSNLTVREPALITATCCNIKTSSQHLFRQRAQADSVRFLALLHSQSRRELFLPNFQTHDESITSNKL